MNVWQSQMDLGELAQGRFDKGNHTFIAKRLAESPTGTIRLMESICEWENMQAAMRRVEKNGGAPGVDNMTTSQLLTVIGRMLTKTSMTIHVSLSPVLIAVLTLTDRWRKYCQMVR